MLTLLLAHFLRQRLIVRPALSFADYIHAEAADLRPKPPALPGWWQPLAGAAADAFEAQRSALARIQDSEALKSAIINSVLDALITIDETTHRIELEVPADEVSRRLEAWKAPAPRATKGVLAKYARLVSSASQGAVTG